MNKQEVIRKAWLEFLNEEDFNNLILDDDGFSNYQCRRYINQSRWNDLYSRTKKGSILKTGSDLVYRPKSLAGIENNNGWIKIENEADLPKDLVECYAYDEDGDITYFTFNLSPNSDYELMKEQGITHYQPIVKPKPPIY